jgi:hypothetical protein
MKRLLNLGFVEQGEWLLNNDSLDYNIMQTLENCSLLYCFVVNNIPKYIGVTRKGLNNRMYQYKNPSISQSTNIRINNFILNELNEHRVKIYTLIDQGQLKYSGFSVNIAHGLEYNLISQYNPEWNSMGRQTPVNNNIIIQPEEEINFGIRLVATYQLQGFINIPAAFEENFGRENDSINVSFNNQIFEGKIYRRSNNGYPRIYVGPVLSNWLSQFQTNSIINVIKTNDTITLEIINQI